MVKVALGLRQVRIAAHIRIDRRPAVAGIDRVSGVQREAGLERDDAGGLPSAERQVKTAVRVHPAAAAPERQYVCGREREAVGSAVRGDAAIQVAVIERIAIAALPDVDQLRKSESRD